MAKIQRALLSVSDKTGLVELAAGLAARGVELLSTGGTYKALRSAGLAVREVSEHTGFPEMLDGRVKTLHPKIHGGLLGRRDLPEHRAAMAEHGIAPIDLVVVNLYPFEATVAKPGVVRDEAVEQIDIGGPSMIRSAAKNHSHVAVVVDVADYARVLEELEQHDGEVSAELRRELALKAFQRTAAYDAAIAEWLFEDERRGAPEAERFPATLVLSGRRVRSLRYGENPHQKAALYVTHGAHGDDLAAARVLGGKELSYNNYVDLESALRLAREFAEPFACVIKHNNACGAATAPDLAKAIERAWAGDPVSAFGSVLAFNRAVDVATAEFLVADGRFVEAIAAPGFAPAALEVLTTRPKWGKNVRLVELGELRAAREEVLVRPISGGFLAQTSDAVAESAAELRCVTQTAPTAAQSRALLFAARLAKHVGSNAIVLAQADGDGAQVVGVGAGQMSRVDAGRIALHKAGTRAQGSALASDAFFPFPDGVELAIEGGVAAILQPGGSVRDNAVVESCDQRGVPMVFTGVRHFRH